ncbi:MAG: hypothetical protein WBA43_19135 [Elainellaceae cyanobacterium]
MPSARRVIDSDRTHRSPIGWVVEGDAGIVDSRIVAIAGVGHIVGVRLVASSTDAKDYEHNSLDTGGSANAIGCRRLTTSAEVVRSPLHSSGKAGLVAIGWDGVDGMDFPNTLQRAIALLASMTDDFRSGNWQGESARGSDYILVRRRKFRLVGRFGPA